VDLNQDFIDVKLERGEIQEMWTVCQQGGVSRQTFHEFLQKAEVIPPDRDLDEELALIEAAPPPGLMAMGTPPQPSPQGTTRVPAGQQGSSSQEKTVPGRASPGSGPKSGGNKPGFETVQGQSGIDHPTP
jgi:hypothetical protein